MLDRQSYGRFSLALIVGLALAGAIAGVACSAQPNPQPERVEGTDLNSQSAMQGTQIAGTVAAVVEQTVSALTGFVSETPNPTRTPTPEPTPSPPPTQSPLSISVSQNTNCRSGPGANYDYRGVLLAGESTLVVAASTVDNYWYVENPDVAGERCWLWDQYASLDGDPSHLPRYTPEPSPTPSLDFVLYVNRIEPCGSSTYVHLTIHNTGGTAFVSGQIAVTDLDNGQKLHGPVINRHPFNFGPLCPPDHGNYLGPGQAAYVSADIKPVPSGHIARATIKACTADYGGGDCLTRSIDFQIP